MIANNKQQKVEELLRKIYELYADYVLKNPFYSLDMPIRLGHTDTTLNYVYLCCIELDPSPLLVGTSSFNSRSSLSFSLAHSLCPSQVSPHLYIYSGASE